MAAPIWKNVTSVINIDSRSVSARCELDRMTVLMEYITPIQQAQHGLHQCVLVKNRGSISHWYHCYTFRARRRSRLVGYVRAANHRRHVSRRVGTCNHPENVTGVTLVVSFGARRRSSLT